MRNRDRFGNRLPWRYAFSVPIVDEEPLDGTPLVAIERIRERRPLLAARLHHFYDHKLRPALQRLQSVRAEEEARLRVYNADAVERNAAITARQETLRVEREVACAPVLEEINAVENRLTVAHQTAGDRFADTGSTYDPRRPAADSVLRQTPLPLEEVAAELKLPWTPADPKVYLSLVVAWLVTGLVGVLIGLSIGIMAGMLPPDDLLGKPLPAVLCALVGIAAAILGKQFLKLSHRELSQRYWLGYPCTNWGPFLLLALGVDVSLLWIDSVVEREGLLANLRLHEMTQALASGAVAEGGSGKEGVYFLAAILLTFGYVGANAWEGYLCGRSTACLNRIRARQSALFATADTDRRADPSVQAALAALVRVHDLLRQKAVLEAHLADVEKPFRAQVEALEQERKPLIDGLSEQARQRIQDAIDNVMGAQSVFDRMLAEALAECEPSGHFWQRVRFLCFGPRPFQDEVRERQ